MSQDRNIVSTLAHIVKNEFPDLAFKLFEIGARPLSDTGEPYRILLDAFPASQLWAFELDEKLCQELNTSAPNNVRYYAVGLGELDEERELFVTEDPACTSLYEPDTELLDKYHGLEGARVKSVESVSLRSLDSFVEEHGIESIDFIKIDVQGAERDIFRGGKKALQNTCFIVSEIEFIPIYKDQPLFGDVSAELDKHDLMFHKFTSVGGGALKPTMLQNNPHAVSQFMWSDAIYIKKFSALEEVAVDVLLKVALLALIYGSIDVAVYCLKTYDDRTGRDLARQFAQSFA